MDHESDAARLSLVVERLVRTLRVLTSDDPLSQSAAGVLSRLDNDGPQGVTALARAERVSQPAMTQLVARLRKEGLVSQESAAGDRRSVVVSLTASGTRALGARRSRRTMRMAEAIEQLTPTERGMLGSALPALERLVEVTHATQERER